MRYHGLYIFICILLFTPVCVAGTLFETSEPEEVFLTFRYRQIVNTHITGLYYRDTVYLPLGEIFSTLHINHTFDTIAGSVSGFFLNEETRYLIDFQEQKAVVGRRTFPIESAYFVLNDYEYYVLPELLKELFDLSFSVHLGNLSLNLFTDHTMPVVERYQRRLRNRYAESFIQLKPHAPLIYGRDRSWFNGGVLDYRLMALHSTDGNEQYTYALNGGIELAGGDLYISSFGGFVPGGDHSNTTRYRWRYVFDENRYITRISLGEVFSDGIVRSSAHGIHITNQPIEPRRVLATYSYSDKTEPEWEVELYINDRLFAITTADETGFYNFEIPLMYGSSRLEVRTYGPGGGFSSDRRRIEIPYTFIPPGEVYYSFNAGRTYYTGKTVAQMRAYAGVSKSVTVSAGVEYHNDIYGDRPVGIANVTFRPAMQYLVDIDIAPSLYHRLRFETAAGERSRAGIALTGYANSSGRFNLSRLKRQIDAYGSSPVMLGRQALYLRFGGSYQVFETREGIRGSAEASTSVNGMLVTTGLHTSHQMSGRTSSTITQVSAGVLYRVPREHLPGNVIIRSRVYYNPRNHSFDNITLSLSRKIGRRGRLEGQYSWNRVFGGHLFNLRLNFDFQSFRSLSNTWQNGRRTTFSQRLQGSIVYDSNNHSVLFHNNSLSGSGLASLRFFIDEDGSGMYEKGEPVVTEVPVRFRHAVGKRRNGEGIEYAYHLRPYVRYSVDIDEDKIPNPFLVPLFDSFSFVADPNSLKQIDIPLQAAGEISGTVVRASASDLNGVNGVRLIVYDKANGEQKYIRTFSDGSFYYMGLPPGTYEITVDTLQLAGTQLYPDPPVHFVTIEPSRYGDYAEGLDFILREYTITDPEADAGQPCSSDRSHMVIFREYNTIREMFSFADEIVTKLGIEPLIKHCHERDVYFLGMGIIQNRMTADSVLADVQVKIHLPDAFIQVLESGEMESTVYRLRYYTVRNCRRENLWNIAGMVDIYNQHTLWPKIWAANIEKIKNPDLIYPGQVFRIPPKKTLTAEESEMLRRYHRGEFR